MNSNVGGFDGSSIPPTLIPPDSSVDGKGVPLKKGGKESGKTEATPQEAVKHDFVYGDDSKQKQPDASGLGVLGSLGATLSELAGEVEADSSVSSVQGSNTAAIKDMISSASGVDSKYAAKFNTLSEIYNATDWNSFANDFPNLAKYGNFDFKTITKDMAGNPCLDTSFITSITEDLMQVGNMNKGAQYIQGMLAASLMKVYWDLGQALGQLAMDKANLEAQMHMFEAMVSLVTFGINAGFTAFSLGGMGLKKFAGMKAEGETGTDESGVKAGGAKMEAEESAGKVSSFREEGGPKIGGSREGTGTGKGEGTEWTKGTIEGKDAKPKPSAHRETEAKINAKETEKETQAQKTEEKEKIKGDEEEENISKEEQDAATWKKGQMTQGQEGQKQAETGASTKSDADAILEGKGTKAKPADEPEAGPAGGEEAGTGAVEAKKKARWAGVATGAEFMEGIGNMFTTGGGAGQLSSAGDNFVQMVFKPLIGEVEQQTEIDRAAQTVTKQSMDSVMQSFSDSGKGVDSAYDTLKKIQDAEEETFKLRRG